MLSAADHASRAFRVLLVVASTIQTAAARGQTPLPPELERAIRELRSRADPDEAMDEALGGMTVRGTPIHPRTPDYFPSEQRDIFWRADRVANGDGALVPLDFDVNRDGRIDDRERNAIRGRNTWVLWGGGNEAFWGWLQERGYGLTDFLILMDSRARDARFADKGLINRPGFASSNRRATADPIRDLLGLHIDWIEDEAKGSLLPPPDPASPDARLETRDAFERAVSPPVGIPPLPGGGLQQLFEPGDPDLYNATLAALPKDGVDYSVYGYPSGIVGLRMLPNPDFFGKTEDAARARAYWRKRVVETDGAYYTDPEIHMDPDLVRPFRVTQSCGFCHVSFHPLLPPDNPEAPEWDNISTIIGGQYWKPRENYANLTTRKNFLYHFLKSQPPGTIDTSLVSTDHLNNTNVINAIFDLPARLERARTKPAELQAGANLLFLGKKETDPPEPLHCPMVLFPGEDSVGVIPALARVPLNIGVFSEQWARSDNPVIGFTPQRPFSVATCRTNSVYWMVNEKYRVPYMAAFFTLGGDGRVPKSTQAMKLAHARKGGVNGEEIGKEFLAEDTPGQRERGRRIFLENCAICHSSKQPDAFDLRFARTIPGGWKQAPAPAEDASAVYTLPATFTDWEDFRSSPAFQDYRRRIGELARDPGFFDDNFLSNELRIPVTLVGTNASRALATNAMRGNVWDNYSSETFKTLPSVGKIRYHNPHSAAGVDFYGTNAEFDDGRSSGGPGNLRPPSLISLWATAPYFHNNAIGLYNHNPSVEGRMEAFEDGIRKILNNDRRALPSSTRYAYSNARRLANQPGTEVPWIAEGDLRPQKATAALEDPGYVYRIPVDCFVEFAPGFIRPLIEGVVGRTIFLLLSVVLWVVLVVIFGAVALFGRARHAGVVVILVGIALGAGLAVTGLGGFGGSVGGALMLSSSEWLESATWLLWIVPLLVVLGGAWLSVTRRDLRRWVFWSFLGLAIVTAGAGVLTNKFLNGRLKDRSLLIAWLPNSWLGGSYKGVSVGPVPRGTPVDLLMNMDPQKRDKLPAALVALARATARIKKDKLTGDAAYRVFFSVAGPALLDASKCPDFVLDRGHWFGEQLTATEKESLIAFLKTL